MRIAIDRAAGVHDGVTAIQLDLLLAGKGANTRLSDPGATPVSFPTSVTLEIQNGGGEMLVLATGYNRLGQVLGRATGSVAVVVGSRAELSLTLADVLQGDMGFPADLVGSDIADLTTPADLPADLAIDSTLLLGDATIEGSTDSHTPGLADASKYVAATSGTVKHLTVFHDAGDVNALVIGLYDDVSGHPHTLLTSATLPGPIAGAWNTVLVPSAAVTAGQSYWIALVAPAGSGSTFTFPYGSRTGPITEHSAETTLTTMPAVWTTGQTFPNTICSFYASQ